ncbi:hypothetical protein D3C72_1752170 [compost metagenome]
MTGKPSAVCATASCMKTMPRPVSPRAAALTGAEPDLVYCEMLPLRAFRYSKAFSSPMICTSEASAV